MTSKNIFEIEDGEKNANHAQKKRVPTAKEISENGA